jgi:hypothetical protein
MTWINEPAGLALAKPPGGRMSTARVGHGGQACEGEEMTERLGRVLYRIAIVLALCQSSASLSGPVARTALAR